MDQKHWELLGLYLPVYVHIVQVQFESAHVLIRFVPVQYFHLFMIYR